MNNPYPETPEVGRRILSRFHCAGVRFGELLIGCRYVLDPSTGRPVMPVPAQVLGENRSPSDDPDSEVVLFVPDDTNAEAAGSLQLLATPEAIDPRTHEAGDRYLVYHGTPPERTWAVFNVVSARWSGVVVSGDELVAGNLLRDVEARVCKSLNADPAGVAHACERASGTYPLAPLVVGVDPYGIDVRARFGIIRIEFEASAESAGELVRRLAELGLRWSG